MGKRFCIKENAMRPNKYFKNLFLLFSQNSVITYCMSQVSLQNNNNNYFVSIITKEESGVKQPENKCNACYNNDCSNNATCQVSANNGYEYECMCAPGFYGEKCNQTIDACYGQPCKNKGYCKILMEGRYK